MEATIELKNNERLVVLYEKNKATMKKTGRIMICELLKKEGCFSRVKYTTVDDKVFEPTETHCWDDDAL